MAFMCTPTSRVWKREKVPHRVFPLRDYLPWGRYNVPVLRTVRLIVIITLLLSSLVTVAQNGAHIILILPFENTSKAPGLEWISEAFPEVLGTGLGSGSAYIIPRRDRNSAFDRIGVPTTAHLSRETLYRISEQMDADYVVLGAYDYDGKTFSATAQLLDMNKLYLAPEVKETGPLVNMVEIQRSLAWDLLRELKLNSLPGKQQFLESLPPIRLDAFENYVRGVVATPREEKIQRFREAVKLNPHYTQAMYQLAQTYYANHEYESAASWFARVQPGDPLAGEASFYRGLSSYYIGDFDASEAALKTLASQFPLPEVINNLGVVMGRRGKRAELDYLQKAAETDPNDPDYHFNLAVAYARVFENAHATRELKETIRLRSSDTEAKSFLDSLNGSASLRPASSSSGKLPLQRVKRTYDATSYQQLAMEIERTAETRLANSDPKQHAAFHVDRGRQLLAQGFASDAKKAFEEAITLDPTSATAHAGLAETYAALGNDQQAVSEASAALKLQPSAGAFLLLARQNLKDNKLSAASEQVEQALQLDPRNQDAQALKRTIDEKLAVTRN
jgi:Tfp pilus assembly protein PilF/TolB-like protein